MDTNKIIQAIKESRDGINSLIENNELINNVQLASNLIGKTISDNSRIFSCGNGGSMCDAMHFSEELSGRFRENRKGLPSVSISDPSYLTCVANDFGFEFVFSRYLEANSKENDLLLAISTSGESSNIIKACEFCKKNNVKLITLTGKKNSTASKYADIDICTPNGKYSDRVQEIHTLLIHVIVEIVEDLMFYDIK